MKYIVIDEPSGSFSEKVEIMLNAGWNLCGGVSAVRVAPGIESVNIFGGDSPQVVFGGVRLFQAMTNESDSASIPEECLGSFCG